MKKYTLIKASAGSGKTYQIAKEYIEFILKNPYEIKNILAITFTNKAAFEMKERILEFLKGLAGFDELVSEKRINSIEQLKKEIKIKLKFTDEEIKEKSKECLERILYSKNGNGYSDFSVMTIDSFTNRLVKVFSEDLNISPSYEISLNIKNIIKKYIDVLISKVSDENQGGKELKDILIEYLYLRSEEGKSLNIELEIFKTAMSIREREKNFDESIEVKGYDKRKIENILESVKTFEEDFKQRCKNIKDINVGHVFGRKNIKKIIGTFFDNLNESQTNVMDLITKNENKTFPYFYNNEFNFDDFLSTDTKKIEKFKQSKEYEKLEKEFSNFHSFLRKNLVKYFENKIYLKNIYTNLLYERINNLIEEYQRENEIVFIDELNRKIKELFKDEVDIPFIYFKIGEKFKKFLIDEFQDTSFVQWDNLKPLIENGIAEGYNCTLVGDDKQAIYRFRGGSTDVIKEFEKDENVEKRQLTKNWRSEENIVKFNGEFFKDIDRCIFEDEEDQIYTKDNVVQKPEIKNSCGYVEINIIEKDLKKEILEDGKLIEIITDCLKRGYKQSAISVLVRTSAEGSKIAEILTGVEIENQRIKIVSADTLFIKDNPYVFFIVSLLKFSIFNSLEDFANLLYSWKDMDVKDSKFKNAEEIFLQKIREKSKYLNYDEILKILLGKNVFNDYNEKIKKSINFLTPYELVSRIIEHIINPNCNDYTGSVSYIVKLLDESYKFGKEGSVIDFLEYYDENRDELKISSPSEQDAITISTIHKSKGLEYDVVIVPFATWDGRKKFSNSFLIKSINGETMSFSYGDIKKEMIKYLKEQDPLKKEREIERKNIFYDDLNLLYVAFTRAKKELYVFTKKKKDSKKKKEEDEDEDEVPAIIELINNKCSEKEFINYKYSESQVIFGKKFSCLNDTKNNQNEDKQRIEIVSKLNLFSHEQDLFLDRSLKRILNIEKENEKIKKGDILHKLLSLIYTENDVENALNYGLIEGFFSINEKENYENLLKNIVKDSVLSKFFKQELKVFNEKDICFEGKILRPDKIVFDGQKCYIVDYKTGLEQKSHIEQIKEYMRFFKKKNFEVKGFLVYVDSMKTIEVEYEVS
ncbi:MAG: UvrD-helicase domain-containing protein [candidate division WOR-3 bacterium]